MMVEKEAIQGVDPAPHAGQARSLESTAQDESEAARRQGRFGDALELATRSIQANPSDCDLLLSLSRTHLQAGNPVAAEIAANEAQAIQPDRLHCLVLLSEIASRQNKIDRAHYWADQAIAKFPNRSNGFLARANAHLLRGEIEYAVSALAEAQRRSPDNEAIAQRLKYTQSLRHTEHNGVGSSL